MKARDLLMQHPKKMKGVPITDEQFCEALVSKYQPLLEGIEDELPRYMRQGDIDCVKTVAAFLLENQIDHLKNLAEDTRAISVGPFMRYVLPLIRRTAVRLVATQIAAVQPMTGPIGGIAFYRPKYATSKGQINAGDEINKTFNRWYSSPYIDGELFQTGDGATVAFGHALRFPKVETGSVRVYVDAVLVGTDSVAAGVITPVAGATPLLGAGTINYADAMLTLLFTGIPATGQQIKIEYRYDMELNSRLPEIQIDIELKEIKAESRKLKSFASIEAADDLRALWGRNLDADLVATMADEMTAEIDREIVGTALAGVDPIARVPWDAATPANLDESQHLRSLVIRMTRASQLIHRRTQRSGANWAITSSEISALLMNMDGFQSLDDGHTYQGGIVKGGVLAKSWQIFIDPEFPQNKILMGFQGPSILDTGIVYAPYIPMEITPVLFNPDNQSLTRSVRTRHKIMLVRPEFFARVDVDNME